MYKINKLLIQLPVAGSLVTAGRASHSFDVLLHCPSPVPLSNTRTCRQVSACTVEYSCISSWMWIGRHEDRSCVAGSNASHDRELYPSKTYLIESHAIQYRPCFSLRDNIPQHVSREVGVQWMAVFAVLVHQVVRVLVHSGRVDQKCGLKRIS